VSALTEIYDDYIDSYGDEPPRVPLVPSPGFGSKSDKISAWARANANPSQGSPAVQRSASAWRSTPSSVYAPSNYGGGSMKRRLNRRNTRRLTAAPSMYNEDEEEEGYGSGEYDDGPFELVKIRVKVRRLPFCLSLNYVDVFDLYSCIMATMFVVWRLHPKCGMRNSSSALRPSSASR
jgi:hypothetical protein